MSVIVCVTPGVVQPDVVECDGDGDGVRVAVAFGDDVRAGEEEVTATGAVRWCRAGAVDCEADGVDKAVACAEPVAEDCARDGVTVTVVDGVDTVGVTTGGAESCTRTPRELPPQAAAASAMTALPTIHRFVPT